MAKKRKPYTPFATDATGKKYVHVHAVMSPLIPFIDGLRVAFFGREKRGYLLLDDAIRWVEKEMQCHSRAKYEKVLVVLRRFRDQGAGDDPVSSPGGG